MVGEGGSQSQFEALAGKLGVGDRVRFLTGVPDRDLPALYNLAEVYLGVSRQAESMVEGFGISLVEASACGLPVIGGRSGGIPDTVKEGETGILVDPDSAQATAEGIRRILQDTALARRLGAGGRRAVETYFNWTRVTEDMMRIAEEFSVQAPTPPRAR